MEHKIVFRRINGYPTKECEKCGILTHILIYGQWVESKTIKDDKLINSTEIQCPVESINDLMRLIYKTRDRKLYQKYAHRFDKNQKLYLQQFI